MKILGFIFESKPGVGAHVDHSIFKFNRALWSLTHLRRANINNVTLLEVYKVMLLPILEYCAVIYNPMLTQEQEQNLERQQKRALQIIYGFKKNYEELLTTAGIVTLKQRREKMCSDFAAKLAASERFSDLFPLATHPEGTVVTRGRKTYQESFARTSRLYNSPLFSMRRQLNDT